MYFFIYKDYKENRKIVFIDNLGAIILSLCVELLCTHELSFSLHNLKIAGYSESCMCNLGPTFCIILLSSDLDEHKHQVVDNK